MRFQSERLVYREFTEEDFQKFYSVFSDEQVMKYAFLDRCNCEEEILPYFKQIMENNNTVNDRKAYEYAVYLLSDGSFIGFADIMVYKKNQYGGCCEIGYFLLPDQWGMGYATEIASSLVEISFKYLNFHRTAATCNANNPNSENVMKKVGMKKEGEARKARFKDGRWDNELQYSIIIDDWKDDEKVIQL
jgi:ribosomal-protein-alanine N-acetyltransferase